MEEVCPFCGCSEFHKIGYIEAEDQVGSMSAINYFQTIYKCQFCGLVAYDNNFGYKKNFVRNENIIIKLNKKEKNIEY